MSPSPSAVDTGGAMARNLGCVFFVTGLALVAAAWAGSTRPPVINLHNVDWADETLPGAVCGAKQPIRLHHHTAVVNSTGWAKYRRVTVDSGWNPVVYGDLDGDGQDEAALVVDCNNGGGTADGVMAYAQVIFTAGEKSPRVLGVVTPQSSITYGAPLVQVKIEPGKIVAHEFWYGPKDGTCCASGRVTTVWKYVNGKAGTPGAIRLLSTRVVRKPKQ